LDKATLFKYDTHTHTRQGSACAYLTGAELARLYAQNGYAGIIVTDHFFNGNCAVARNLPLKRRVELFCAGYEDARSEGAKRGLSVFFGWEYNDRATELLTYGLTHEFILEHPEIERMPLEEYCDLVHAHGGFLSHAHPFRKAPYIPAVRLFPDRVDAVEVYNASHRDPAFNRQAKRYAQKYKLLQTAGSDTHYAQGFAGGGMAFARKLDSMEDFIRAVKNREGMLLPEGEHE